MNELYNSQWTGSQIDEAIGDVRQNKSAWSGKQDEITGNKGQVIGFNAEGKPVAQDKPSYSASEVGAYTKNETNKLLQNKADLGEDGKVPESQLPELGGSQKFTGTITTNWTEDSDTGVKYQLVAIPGVLATHDMGVLDVIMTHEQTSDGYAAFVEENNQFLAYITNGYAETYDGGVKFYIFGDAPTVEIPFGLAVG